jgi:geranylgeranyl pyrophosphate synthase
MFTKETLQSLTPIPSAAEESLRRASEHALNSDGSLGRARLAEGLCAAFAIGSGQSKRLGAGIELFHLASLIIDDLPCMDDASTRRSQTCTHALYGESSAILASLGFINRAYFLLWELFAEYDTDTQKEAASLVNDCLGFDGILDGQSKDIRFFYTHNDSTQVAEIAEKKTGALLRLCLLIPAILGQSSRYQKMQLSQLALNWGLAYQIADDLKDIFQSEAHSGKTPQRDAILGRPNMALAIGEDAAISMLQSLLASSDANIDAISEDESHAFKALRHFQHSLAKKAQPLLVRHVAA